MKFDPWAGAVRVMRAYDIINDREIVRLDVALLPFGHGGTRVKLAKVKQYTLALGRWTGKQAIANGVTKLRRLAKGRKPLKGLLKIHGPRDSFV